MIQKCHALRKISSDLNRSEGLSNVTFCWVISYCQQLPDPTGKIRGIFCTLACDPNTFPATKQPSSQASREKSLPEPNLLAKTFQRGLPSRVPGKKVPPRAGQGGLTYSGLLLNLLKIKGKLF
jgi:hypothetical protein